MADITLSGTIVDSDSVAWANAKVVARLVSYGSPEGSPTRISTGAKVPVVVTTYLDSTGVLSLDLAPSNDIYPVNTQWQIEIQPNVSTPVQIVTPRAYNASADVSSIWNAQIKAPRFLSGYNVRAYNAVEIEAANLGDTYINTTPSSTPTYTAYMWDGVEWVPFGGGGGGGGITGLNQDVLAGTSPFTPATCVMVHAFDDSGATPNSLFYIETEVPPFPGATTDSIGLYAKNTFGNTGTFGKFAIAYDNDDLGIWVLYFQDRLHTPNNVYIYANEGLYIISDLSGEDGNPQWFFGNNYDGTGQLLGIYFNSTVPNSIYQLASYGIDTNPFLVFGRGAETIQMECKEVFVSSGISFDPTPTATPTTNITGSVAPNSIEFQATAGFGFGTGSSFTDRLTAEYGVISGEGWRLASSGTAPLTLYMQADIMAAFQETEIDFYLSGFLRYKIAAVSVTDETLSRSFGTVYQNTSGQNMQVAGYGLTSISSTGTLTAFIGPSSASVEIFSNTNTASVSTGHAGFSFIVPPDYFYEIQDSGDITGVGLWTETLF